MHQITLTLPVGSHLGESPLWDPRSNQLYWTDILEQRVHSFDPATQKVHTHPLSENVTSIALKKGGGFVATSFKDFMLLDSQVKNLTSLVKLEEKLPDNRFNDGKCDRSGRFWAGTINQAHIERPTGTLYSFSLSGKATATEKNAICLNGMGWSLDDKIMYVAESLLHTIFAYDFDSASGTISNKRPFISFPKHDQGVPDGLTVDSEGCIWSVLCMFGQVVRIDPTGKIMTRIHFPASRVTSCTFGGKDLKTLYVTSAKEHMTADELKKHPHSGHLFAVQTDVKGIAETEVCF